MHAGNLSASIAITGFLLVLWLLGIASGTTLGGVSHALPAIAIFVALMYAARARR